MNYSPAQAADAIAKAAAAGAETVQVAIPDTKDEVSELNVGLTSDTMKALAAGNVNLEINTTNIQLILPQTTLDALSGDYSFKVTPVKSEAAIQAAASSAKQESIVQQAAGTGAVSVVGRPVTVETNAEGQAIDLVLPLPSEAVPADAAERAAFLADLAVYIEHSDGTKELVQPELVQYDNNQQLGLKFSVTKFSTFTILQMDNWSAYQDQQSSHQAYIQGYPDGKFRPGQAMTRAEVAAVLSRVGNSQQAGTGTTNYSDSAKFGWAADAISQVTAAGWMSGYQDGTFGPQNVMTRAEMAAVLVRWMNLTGEASASFTDTQGHWSENNIALVQQAGYMNGMPDGSFQPDKALSRAEAVAIINRVLNRGPLTGVTTPAWSDVPAGHWAYADIEEASISHHFTAAENGAEVYAEE